MLALNPKLKIDKKGKKVASTQAPSKVQIFSFKQLAQVRDSLVLKNGDAHLLSSASSQSTKAHTVSDGVDDRFAAFDSNTPVKQGTKGDS